MAYQKLQVERALEVIPSDTIDIPAVSGPAVDSTMTQPPILQRTIIDATQDFTAIVGLIGSPVIIGTSIARVESVNSAATLTLDAPIAGAAAVGYKIYVGATNPGCVLYSGTGGDIRVLTSSGADLTFVGTAPGAFIPVQVKRVFDTGTDAESILALW